MNVRGMINQLIREYKFSLVNILDGDATIEEQETTQLILDSIQFYTDRLLVFGNHEIEGT